MASSGESAEMPKETNSQDLATKYEKLAAEYAKIKAQAIVLKKAVIEEQNKNSDLKLTIRSQEQSLRKNEQEVESLLFRNQQLTKRVNLLQDDLEEEKKSANKKGGKKGGTFVSDNNGVLDEDFKRLIEENAKLHIRVQEKEDEHSSEIIALHDKIDNFRRELRESKQECKAADDKYKPTINKLERDLSERNIKLKTLETVSDQLKVLQTKYNSLERSFNQIEYFANNLSKHFPSEGLISMKLNNISLSDECEMVLYKCIIDIITGLTSFFSQLSNRLSYLSDVSFQNKFKYVQTLCDHGKGIIQKFINKNVLESISIVEYKNLLDSLLDSIKTLNRSQHSNLLSNLMDFISHLLRIFNVLPYLFIEKNKIYISNNALVKVISELVLFEQLAKMLHSIFQNETDSELKSNLKNMEELMSVNDCFLESLATLENSIQILAINLTQLLLGLNDLPEHQHTHKIIQDFSKQASQYIVSHELEHINKSKNSQQYEIQLEELNELKELYDKQICDLTLRIQQLDKEKVSIQNQYEILLLRNDSSLNDIDEQIIQYYQKIINALIEEKHEAIGQASMMVNECTSLHRRLEFLVDSEHELNELTVKWKQYAAQLKDELRSTTNNYETQLSVMSEHLVDLNIDLNSKRDAIEQLNSQLSNKSSKSKGKS